MIQKSKYQMDVLTRSYAKKLFDGVSSGYKSSTVTDNADGSKTLTINFVNGDKADITFNPVKGDKGDTGASVADVEIREVITGTDEGIHLFCILDDGTEIDAGTLPNEQYDDTQIKSDIKTLQNTKQNSTDTNLTTTEKTVTGAINEIYGNSLDVVGFSSDYKNIILNRKNGLNPVTIPLVSIISHSKLVELFDIDISDIGNGKTLVYDSTTQKHKYVDSTGTDELVKMDSTTDSKYLTDLIDKQTVVNENGTLKVKKLDGQEVTIAEINYLKGLTMNVMDLVNMFANGGVKIINAPVNTYADLLVYDKSSLIDGISYLIYVLADETHNGAKTTYLIDKATTTPTFFGNADSQRNFVTNPIDLANEVTGKLPTDNIDVDALWLLLTINNTYKTLTTKNEPFGTHGAKAMYDELVTAIGDKANSDDFTKHTGDTDIHISATEKASYVKKTDIVDNLTSTDTDKPLSANQGRLLNSMIVTLTGVVLPYAGTTVPTGFLLCNGQAVSRTDYPQLFSVIGTTYGEGDGSTTFNLPNLQNKFIQGTGTNAVGTEMSAGLPNITGRAGHFSANCMWEGKKMGAFKIYGSIRSTQIPNVAKSGTGDAYYFDFDASLSNSIYGNSTTVQPPAVVMNYIIKY